MKKEIAYSMSSFVAKVRLRDPSYQERMSAEMADKYVLSDLPFESDSNGLPMVKVVVPEWLDWGYVPYLDQNECCCSHSDDECPIDEDDEKGHASTMCLDCVDSWEIDWEVIRPTLV